MSLTKESIDINQVRKDTPACKDIIHFNNAGASLMPRQVSDFTLAYIKLESEIGPYEAAEKMSHELYGLYDSIGTFIGSSKYEIAVIENATRAWDMIFYSLPFKAGDKILTSVSEYASNYIAFLQMVKRKGVKIEVVPNDEYGQLSISALKNMLDEKVKLVAVTHVPTNGGLINPAKEIGDAIKDTNALYILDACQSIGQLPINVKEIGCHFLSATSRKYLRGPRGVGFLYVDENIVEKIEPIFLDLHSATWTGENEYEVRSDARKFENWESNFAGKIGLKAAVDYAAKLGINNISSRIQNLASMLREKLASIKGVQVCDLGKEKCGIVSFVISKRIADEVKILLSKQNINVSISGKSYTLIDMQQRKIQELVRASVHYYNTDKEIDMFCKTIERIS